MQLLHDSETRNMTLDVETNSRPRLRQQWEDPRSSLKATNTLDHGYAHGDANSWILELCNPETRGQAMQNLCSNRRLLPDLGVLLWYSFGSVSGLMQEIMAVYSEWKVEKTDPARVINALRLLEAIAEHPKSKIPFVCSRLHQIIAPLVTQGPASPQHEEYRFRALRVISALLAREVSHFIEGREYGCIAMQLLADDYLHQIITTTVDHGGILSQETVVQILASMIYHEDIFTVFTKFTHLRKRLYLALDRLHGNFSKEKPELCRLVLDLFRRVHDIDRPRTSCQGTPPVGTEMAASRKCHWT